jgi:hypothetical protein
MKKYLFGILAIALAIGFSAFSTKKNHNTTFMSYELNTYTQTQVQDKDNWSEFTATGCSASDKACSVEVPTSIIENGEFKGSIILNAESGTSSTLLSIFDGQTPVADIDIHSKN